MTTTGEFGTSRQSEVVAAAATLFLRYGFRKTSMEDIARAAKLSRQGLYLHFANKEAVFHAVIEHLMHVCLEAAKAELDQPHSALEARLLGAFEAMAESTLAGSDPASVQELFASANELAGDAVRRFDQQIVTTLAAALKDGRRRSSAPGDLSPKALAENLYAMSYGLKQRGHTGKSYRDQMRVAIRVVCKSEGLSQ